MKCPFCGKDEIDPNEHFKETYYTQSFHATCTWCGAMVSGTRIKTEFDG